MSAQLQFAAPAPPQREPMTLADLDDVLAIERAVYEFPWTRGNFIDSLAAGYAAQVLRAADRTLCAYCVSMTGVQEVHLLNLSVAPASQHQGLARGLLDALVVDSRAADALCLWLEVRESNLRAREVYRRYGFEEVGWRRGYYPAAAGAREDACVMRLAIPGSRDALD
jgi:ribosomal-protein-alanine N-acetyltransferase